MAMALQGGSVTAIEKVKSSSIVIPRYVTLHRTFVQPPLGGLPPQKVRDLSRRFSPTTTSKLLSSRGEDGWHGTFTPMKKVAYPPS